MTIKIAVIAIDARQPRILADFWTAALGWTVLADPEGNEFCVLSRSVQEAGGH